LRRGSAVRISASSAETRKITVADHGGSVIVPRGTLGALLKEAGMTADDLRALL
jgi:predicted RNA binding protein YcfA (HicA-like mRNA interferase family)